MSRLRRSHLDVPGITRRRCGKGFHYSWSNGAPVVDEATRSRIKGLAVPPAWTDVWICPWPNGHIQAIGVDSAGRRQYKYHDVWRRIATERSLNERYGSLGASQIFERRCIRSSSTPNWIGRECWRRSSDFSTSAPSGSEVWNTPRQTRPMDWCRCCARMSASTVTTSVSTIRPRGPSNGYSRQRMLTWPKLSPRSSAGVATMVSSSRSRMDGAGIRFVRRTSTRTSNKCAKRIVRRKTSEIGAPQY